MRLTSIFNLKLACFAAALSAFSSLATAAEIKVHLPVTAKWGSQILPPGDYVFDTSDSLPLARVSGYGILSTAFVTSVEKSAPGRHSYVTLVNNDGVPTIAAFSSESAGVTYEFAVSKPNTQQREQARAQSSTGM